MHYPKVLEEVDSLEQIFHRSFSLGAISALFLAVSKLPSSQISVIIQGSGPTTLGKFENTALFLRLGLPSTLIRHDNEAFRKSSSNRRNLKTLAFRFRVEGKTFQNRSFPKKVMSLTMIMRFSCSSFPQNKFKMTGCAFKFLRHNYDRTENIWWVFSVKCKDECGYFSSRSVTETSVFKFLRRSVEEFG